MEKVIRKLLDYLGMALIGLILFSEATINQKIVSFVLLILVIVIPLMMDLKKEINDIKRRK